jgi:hypothetical protein
VVPTGKGSPGEKLEVKVTEQLSEATGGVQLTGPAHGISATKSAGIPVITGDMVSDTVTIAEHVAVFPLTSVAVRTTVLEPTFEQSKLV